MFGTIFNEIFFVGSPRHLLVQSRLVVFAPKTFTVTCCELVFDCQFLVNQKLPIIPATVFTNKAVDKQIVGYVLLVVAFALVSASAFDLVAGVANVTFGDGDIAANQPVEHAMGVIGIFGHVMLLISTQPLSPFEIKCLFIENV